MQENIVVNINKVLNMSRHKAYNLAKSLNRTLGRDTAEMKVKWP